MDEPVLEPGETPREGESPSRPLLDRFHELLALPGVQAAADRQKGIEELIRHGPPGSTQPSLFADELLQAREGGAGKVARTGESPPDLLVLCIGYSPEPLLLAVAYHAPKGIVFLLEHSLEEDYLRTLARLWDEHHDFLGVPPFGLLEKRRVRDTPGDVYKNVRQVAAEHPGARILVDITGAKKSMTAGAFLAAGLLDLDTSYVDFEAYDSDLRRPVPGTSRPGRLDHPYRLFKLRDEARLGDELDRRHYREAERLALSLAEVAGSPEVAAVLGAEESLRQADRFASLARAARGYAFWNEGFYREAVAELTANEDAPVPATVRLLEPVWPSANTEREVIVQALAPRKVFANPARALAYFLDVLVWNDEARIAEDPRQSFLRLYGTIETILFFAFDSFVSRRPERLMIVPEDPTTFETFRARCSIDGRGAALDWDEILRGAAIGDCEKSSALAVKVLRGTAFRPGESAPSGRKLPKGAWKALPACGVLLAAPVLPKDLLVESLEGRDEGGGLRPFSDLRHKAVHWLAPVPREEAVRLLSLYRSILRTLIPPVVAHLREDATELSAEALRSLDEWEVRLLAAADGAIPEDCLPLSFAALSGKGRS